MSLKESAVTEKPTETSLLPVKALIGSLLIMVITTVFFWPRPFLNKETQWSWGDTVLHGLYGAMVVIVGALVGVGFIYLRRRLNKPMVNDAWKTAGRVGDCSFYPAIVFAFWIALSGYDGVNTAFILCLAIAIVHTARRIRKRVYLALLESEIRLDEGIEQRRPASMMMSQPEKGREE